MAETTLKGAIITQAIAIVVFVGVPILITLMVPFSDLALRRTGPTASVTVTRYVLVFIPWRTQTIANVRAVRAEITAEKYHADTSENRRMGRAGATSVATGQLVIEGDGPDMIVQASPDLATETEEEFAAFLAETDPEPVTIQLYASWWLSWVLGGIATFFAAFYIVGAVLAIITWPFKKRRQAAPA